MTQYQSVRTVVLGEQIVPYRLERSRRKTVGMMVDAQGLRVRASPYVSVSEIERILHSKSNWILRHLSPSPHADTPSRRQRFVPDLAVVDGETLTLLGRTVQIRWGVAQQLPEWSLDEQILWVKRPRTRAGAPEADVQRRAADALRASVSRITPAKIRNQTKDQLAMVPPRKVQSTALQSPLPLKIIGMAR